MISEFSDVFISYRRKDVEFVKRLVEALQETGREVWIDWEDIPPGSISFTDDIRKGLEGADAVILVLTPAYFESPYCVEMELNRAISLKKKIIPIVLEKFDDEVAAPLIGHINWIFFTPHAGHENTFEESLPKLMLALDQDHEHARAHKRLGVRALEWDTHERSSSYLLNGEEITKAENWLFEAGRKEPHPTELHTEYIQASRRGQTQRHRRQLRIAVHSMIVLVLMLLATVVLALETNRQRGFAVAAEGEAIRQAETAVAAEHIADRRAEEAESLLLAGKALQLYQSGDSLTALRLAQEASAIENPDPEIRRVLSLAGYAAPREVLALDDQPTFDVAFLDGGAVALIASEGEIIQWDMTAGRASAVWPGYEQEGIYDLALNADESLVLGGDDSGHVMLWDTTTGEIVQEYAGLEDTVQAVAFGPGPGQLAAAGNDAVLLIWDMASGEIVAELAAHDDAIYDFSFSPDGQTVLTASGDGTVRLWDVNTGAALQSYTGHSGEVYTVAFHPAGAMAVYAGQDEMIYAVDVATGEHLYDLTYHCDWVVDLQFTADGRHFLSAGDDGHSALWTSDEGLLRREFVGSTDEVSAIVLLPDERTVAGVTNSSRVLIWEREQPAVVRREQGHAIKTTAVTYSPDETGAVSASADDTAVIWDMTTGTVVHTLTGHTDDVRAAVYHPDGATVVTGALDGDVIVWDVATGAELRRWSLGHGVRTVAFNHAGTQLFAAGNVGEVAAWDYATGEALWRVEAHNGTIWSIAVSPDDRFLLTGSDDSAVAIWDAASGAAINKYWEHSTVVRSVRWLSDNRRAATASYDGSIFLWDTQTGDVLRRFVGHDGPVWSIDVAADDAFLFSSSADTTYATWDMTTGHMLSQIPGNAGASLATDIRSDNGSVLVSDEGYIVEWRLDTFDSLRTFVSNNRPHVELTCDQRETYNILPLCDE